MAILSEDKNPTARTPIHYAAWIRAMTTRDGPAPRGTGNE